MLKRIRDLLAGRGKRNAAAETGHDAGEGHDLPVIRRGPQVVHRPIPETDLDHDAVKILRRLTRFDHSAYLVGGCVRDLLLDRKPKDFDIGTSATPRQVKRIFRNSRIIGRRFRLVHIYFHGGKVIEVATFRGREDEDRDEGSDNDILIRDDNVFGTVEEDALRRDFTVNALFYDVTTGTVLDHAGGLDDLRRRLVRTIGDPDIRFREDPIRILRAVKFAARLDFGIETGTLESIRRNRAELPKAASPRIVEEINRFCRGGASRRSFEILEETGVDEVLLPEIAPAYREDPTARRTLYALLDRIDERCRQGREATGGAILAALLLPLMSSAMGWSENGTASRPKGTNVREIVDETLRPMALRLRLPRKDQEHCRQVMMTLYRMVPAQRLRSNTRRAILRRDSLSDAMWILEDFAGMWHGDFDDALTYWKKAIDAAKEEAGREKPAAGEERKPGRTRSRGSGTRPGSAGKAKGGEAAKNGEAAKSRSGTGRRGRRPAAADDAGKTDGRRKPRADMPSVWDDGYFFAALPTVPDGDGATEQKPPETKGAKRTDGTSTDGPATGDSGEGKPRKRRRRRRRRKPAAARERAAAAETDGDAD